MNNKIKKIHLSIDNETKCYVSYADYKKMKRSYEKKIFLNTVYNLSVTIFINRLLIKISIEF